MTPEEARAALRDIHTPLVEAGGGPGFAWEPLAIFALIAIGLIVWSVRRAGVWRQEAKARLAEIDKLDDPSKKWDALIALLRPVAARTRSASLPDFLFAPDPAFDPERLSALREEIGRRLA